MFQSLIKRLFLEANIVEDDDFPPLDFGEIGPDAVIDDVPEEPTKPKVNKPKFNFLGQPVTSEQVSQVLRKYMANIRTMLKKQFMTSLTDKKIKKDMRQYIRNTIMSKRNSSVAPNVDQKLFQGHKPEKFESFLQEWLYVQYIGLLQRMRKTPAIQWSSSKIDLEDERYVNELLGGKFWDNVKKDIFASEDAGTLFSEFSQMVDVEKARRTKERERGAARRAAAQDQQVAE